MNDTDNATDGSPAGKFRIRRASAADLDNVVALDGRITGHDKSDYWRDIFDRYATRRLDRRFFLIAEASEAGAEFPLMGFIVGEVRVWEFGSEPCGWIFAFSVEPGTRQQGVGEGMFKAISGLFRDAGMRTMRTMVERSNRLPMAFFRSEGMVAGPYIQLEVEIEDTLDEVAGE